jgi:hypothetical protein
MTADGELGVALGGFGAIGGALARRLDQGLPGLRLVAVSARDVGRAERRLAEPPTVSNPHQALTLLLTGELRLARPAAHWAAEHGVTPVRQTLNELPGYALVLLAASPNDTAERFMARDAFWAAVMERS